MTLVVFLLVFCKVSSISDDYFPLPSFVLKNLLDKLYEKRKTTAKKVEGIVKQLVSAGDHEKISTLINLLTNKIAISPQASHRKGGLIGLAATTVGLASKVALHLKKIVPPIINSFADQDNRVQYYACEALYNIAKIARGDIIIFFTKFSIFS